MSKSVTGAVISFIFTVVAYVSYVFALWAGDSSWIVVAALIYFFPVAIDYIETMQTMSFHKKWLIVVTIVFFIIAVIYLIVLLSYLSVVKEVPSISLVWKTVLVACPVICIPIKGYPIFVSICQWYNRSTDGQQS
ncbi:MAG: hypothetical protein E7652_00070 [Ruminococcaceae bacterium]|nr:hypothetical protein [Oscillospiraceae bacterium]